MTTSGPDRRDLLRHHRGILGPAWRYELGRTLTPRCPLLRDADKDVCLRDLVRYLAFCAAGNEEKAAKLFPCQATAAALQTNTEQVDALKLMVLANMPLDEMAERLKMDVAVVETWEHVYFDVRDLLHAVDWIHIFIIAKAQKQGNEAQASRMKLAVMAGPVAVRALLDAEAELPLDEADRLFVRHLKLQLKFDEAANMPLDSERTKMKFIQLHAEMNAAKDRLDLAQVKLAQRCTEIQHRHEREKLRLELALKRIESHLSKRRQKRQQAESRSANRRRQAEDARLLAEYEQRAEGMALQARIVASPLTGLAWGGSGIKTNSLIDIATVGDPDAIKLFTQCSDDSDFNAQAMDENNQHQVA